MNSNERENYRIPRLGGMDKIPLKEDEHRDIKITIKVGTAAYNIITSLMDYTKGRPAQTVEFLAIEWARSNRSSFRDDETLDIDEAMKND